MYHIITNGKDLGSKKNASDIEIVKQVFAQANEEVKFYFTEYVGHGKVLAEQITQEDAPVNLIAMGGDGTLHEVFNGIQHMDKCNFGIIPLGTGNDFADGIGLPLGDVRRAAQVIAFKTPRPIDYIQFSNGLRSINSVGFGIDVDVLQRAYNGNMKGRTKYVRALIASLLHFKSHDFTVRYDGVEELHNGLLACIGNGKQFGGGIKIFPDAKIDDGYLDLIIVDYLNKLQILPMFIKLMMGKLKANKHVKRIRVKTATFIPTEEHYILQAEGELYEDTPMELSIVSNELKFYLP